MSQKRPITYIITNKPYGVLYTGVTSNIAKRLYEHQNGLADGFSKDYKLKTLVYYQSHETMEEAMKEEKRLKNWHRDWKVNLIEEGNPSWFDLSEHILKSMM